MGFEAALRASEMLLAWAFVLQSAEHLSMRSPGKGLFGLRIILGALLGLGVFVPWVLAGLTVIGGLSLRRFQGPFNGGSDKMGMLVLLCLLGAHWAPTLFWAEVALGYLAVQVTLSYFVAGRVKLVNPSWRNGTALRDVFAFSAYPVARDLRGLADWSRTLFAASWAVILFEVLFPLALISQPVLIAALGIAALFHLANACLFGLNRFFWIWLAAYPALLWFQQRVFLGL